MQLVGCLQAIHIMRQIRINNGVIKSNYPCINQLLLQSLSMELNVTYDASSMRNYLIGLNERMVCISLRPFLALRRNTKNVLI